MVLDRGWQMCLVHNRKYVVRAFDGVRDETRVLNHENVVLGSIVLSAAIEHCTTSLYTCGSDTTAA